MEIWAVLGLAVAGSVTGLAALAAEAAQVEAGWAVGLIASAVAISRAAAVGTATPLEEVLEVPVDSTDQVHALAEAVELRAWDLAAEAADSAAGAVGAEEAAGGGGERP